MSKSPRTRYTHLKDINFVAFPVLAAVAVEAGTVRELSHRLMLPMTSIRRRLKQLEQQHLVARRHDNRWIPLVTIRMERVPDPPANPEEKVGPGEPTGPVVIAPEQPEPQENVPTPITPPLPKKKFKVDPSNKASKHFRVPAVLENLGEASVGALGRCKCGNATPLRYGSTSVCPICARNEG